MHHSVSSQWSAPKLTTRRRGPVSGCGGRGSQDTISPPLYWRPWRLKIEDRKRGAAFINRHVPLGVLRRGRARRAKSRWPWFAPAIYGPLAVVDVFPPSTPALHHPSLLPPPLPSFRLQVDYRIRWSTYYFILLSVSASNLQPPSHPHPPLASTLLPQSSLTPALFSRLNYFPLP